ncbi:MAG: prolipoprotein diacylglyceryl transferase family protein [Gemmatimonadales bacterium]
MTFSPVHLVFDLFAAASSLAVAWLVYRWRLSDRVELIERAGPGYASALLGGAVVGGYGLGTINLVLSDRAGVGRSIIGALLGAIITIELFKRTRNIRGSTGLIFVPAICTTVVIGRIGCFLAGMDDFTYGTPTALAWGHDFGDGVSRHAVQLYESIAMLAFLIFALLALKRRTGVFLRNGFYLMVGWYALQRYGWEYLKPYGPVFAGQNVFQMAALVLVFYAIVMIRKTEDGRAPGLA